ncbi:MAG: Ig-like domain-containing protein, partial [Verrucomicrobiota bacterium]
MPTQAGISAAFTYAVPTDPLAIPGGMEKFPGLKLTALGNTGPVNRPPVAQGQTVSVNAGGTLAIVLAGTDPENAPLKYAVVTQPANGALTGTAPNLTYAPKAGFSGNDSFTFTVNDGSLTSAPALVGITVNPSTVDLTPPEFPIDPPPWDMAPCLCGPLVGNYETNQIHTWHVLADGGPLDLQLTTVTVNTNDPQTTIVDAFDGTNRIATVTVSYTAAEARANGLRWEKSASVNLGTFRRGKVLRLESRIGGTPVTQTHHSLQFCGARWLAIDLPSFKALEEDHAAYRFNVKSGESLVLDLDNVGIPTPASGFRYRLIDPSGTVVQRGTNAIVAGPELTVARPAVGLWTLEMRPVGGEHYLLDKPVGADRHAYLDWYTSQRGVKEVRITVNDRPAIGVPFDVSLTRLREVGDADAGDVVVQAVVTNGLARFIELPNGFYRVDVRPRAKDIPAVDFQEDWIYCNNPVTNLFAFRRKNEVPKFDAIANATIDEAKPFLLTLKATDPEGAPLTYALVAGPAGMTVTPAGALAWTPGEDQGPGTIGVSVSVSDGDDSVTNRFTVVVREVNLPPVAGAVPRQSVDEGRPLALTLTATDADLPRQALVFQRVSGPAGLTLSPAGQIAWTPGEESGGAVETVRFTVGDGVVAVPGEFVVAVNEVNEVPVVQNVPDVTIDALKRFSVQLVARDADLPAQKLVFSLLSGPKGMAVSDAGLLEWTPSVEQGSTTYKVEVVVTDGVAKAGTAFVVVVRPSNTAPRIPEIAARTINELSSFNLTLSAVDSDLPAQQLTFALVSGPEGLTVSPAGVVTFRPTEVQGPGTNRV